ncbi:RNA-dependent RNA polymerase [Erysiphe necator associated ourmia-like virus 122]|nr:RNA-dependent RNA polymerase [Erysiphe necator associated ourmia-like virus 122]
MFKRNNSEDSCRVCSSAQRTVKNLRFVSQVLGRESLVKDDFIANGPVTCESLQREWKEWTASCAKKLSGEKAFVFANAVKGTKTLFDEPCSQSDPKWNCDVRAGQIAVEEWCDRALNRGPNRPGKERSTEPAVLLDIRRRTRRIMGKGWFKERKGVYVPDQQGCFEMERGMGGTLSVPVGVVGASEDRADSLYDSLGIPERNRGDLHAALELGHEIPEESEAVAYCRLGKAKQKGKLRVVTMQTSLMKDVLRPVHESAYNRLSRRPWLVRGNVNKDHFESLRRGLHPGFDLVSGDYEASTDNLHKDAVLAVVETLARDLPSREAELFVRSFRDCHVVTEDGICPVVRGSMMGNLGSFVVLCILNRICFERALELAGYPRDHPSLLNGDDILFPGESGLYYSWLHSTSEVGFVINRSKTMRSKKYGDLNSQTYRYDKSRMVLKLCFGFLGSDSWKEPVGSLATPLFELCNQLKFATSAWLLVAFPVRRLLARVSLPLSSIPSRWWNFLVKKGWFRGLLDAADPEPVKLGVERKVPFALGPPIHSTPFLESRIREISDRVVNRLVNEWRGVPVPPIKQKIKHQTFQKVRSKFRLGRRIACWKRLWVAPVLEMIKDHCPDIFISGNPKWVIDQPGLEPHYSLTRSPIRRPFIFHPRIDEFVPLTLSDGSKIFVAC